MLYSTSSALFIANFVLPILAAPKSHSAFNTPDSLHRRQQFSNSDPTAVSNKLENSNGVPSNGVNCSTLFEPSHYLSWVLLSETISAAVPSANTFNFSEAPSTYPVIYSDLLRAPGAEITWADKCGLNVEGSIAPATMFAQPILYDGLTAPSDLDGETLLPTLPATSPDIVVFSLSPGVGQGTYCGVLTNSDAEAKGLTPGPSGNGYHQCVENTDAQEGGLGGTGHVD